MPHPGVQAVLRWRVGEMIAPLCPCGALPYPGTVLHLESSKDECIGTLEMLARQTRPCIGLTFNQEYLCLWERQELPPI